MPPRARSSSERWHRVWLRLRHPDVLPAWAAHTHEWETYSSTCAGCLLCGAQHVCDVEHCVCVECDDGSRVCPVTAHSFPCVRVTVGEYSPCCTTRGPQRLPAKAAAAPPLDDVAVYVQHALSGARTREHLRREEETLTRQRAQAMLRACRQQKQALRQGAAPCLADMFAVVVQQTRQLRRPRLLPARELQLLCAECTRAVSRLLTLLYPLVAPTGALRTEPLVIGLLYMMRQGITRDDVELLPSVPLLRSVLPLESHTLEVFGMRPKTITETENTVKAAIRRLAPRQLCEFAA